VSDPRNDPFWARVSEAGITVVVHAGDSGYSSNGYAVDGFAAAFGGGRWAPSVKAFHIERAAYDFLVTLVFDKLFERFPNVRVASVENGSEFLRDLFKKLRSTDRKMPGYFTQDPVETYTRNVWRGSRDLRFGLAAHRRHAEAARLRGRGEALRRRDTKADPARQRP
jgi:predicted TIM-barrel fold metal-dependent hydrolase